jgi:hypothetical protein
VQDCCIHEVREAQSRLRDLPQDATLQDPSVRRAGAAEALLSNSQDYSTRGTVHGIVKYIQVCGFLCLATPRLCEWHAFVSGSSARFVRDS